MRGVALFLPIFAGFVPNPGVHAGTFYSQLSRCPDLCQNLGPNPANWTVFQDVKQLESCNQTMIFDLSVHIDIEDSKVPTLIRACVAADEPTSRKQKTGCGGSKSTNLDLELAWKGKEAGTAAASSLNTLAGSLDSELNAHDECGNTILLSSSSSLHTIIGVYAGAGIDSAKSIQGVVDKVKQHIAKNGLQESLVAQVCGPDHDRAQTLGLSVSTRGDLGFVQRALRSWSNGACVDGLKSTTRAGEIPVAIRTTASRVANANINLTLAKAKVEKRATCRYIQVAAGDGCGSLASKCGISGANFEKFNPVPSLCSVLQIDQYVCCTEGSLPDFRPQPNPDGSCAAYTVQSGESCDLIAKSHFITSGDIERLNGQTWGWGGCQSLQIGQAICLSQGNPPMPSPFSNAICGPQVLGTKPPNDFSQLASLNPCPLNSCCNIWGQCGITPAFCTIYKSPTGAPGTSPPGTTSCISNCGTSITNNAAPAAKFLKIGYFESWNPGRSCLHMDASQIPSGYTHIHYAFAGITDDFRVDTSGSQEQFNRFKATKGFAKILSFGGWSFSTEADTFPIFREGVTTANRQLFANNVVSFMQEHNLDGLDFDWEYPGAPDIPGIPPGGPNDGRNYLDFLKMVRAILPAGKTLSIAAPASYWYLKGFPIKEMAPVLDYIVYMTYDLHGQWDYGNQFSTEGCEAGNCLRSHVNLTETLYAVAMVTKAGVPAAKVIVGVSSYGRAFGIRDPSCRGPMCTYTGPASGAAAGKCTQEPGYLADAEIADMINQGAVAYHDDGIVSDSDIAIFRGTWVAYMTQRTKDRRVSLYGANRFGGSVDWAIDLAHDLDGSVATNSTQGHTSPTSATIVPIPGCSVPSAPGATFTITAACASGIAGLPFSGRNNKPPGPDSCDRPCNLWQKLTATCCGAGGALSNPVVVSPGVPLPAPMPLPAGFEPNRPIPVPETTYPDSLPLLYPVTIPKGTNLPGFYIPRVRLPINKPTTTNITIIRGQVPEYDVTIQGVRYEKGKPVPENFIIPPGFTTSNPVDFGPVTLPPGPLPVPIIVPPGYIPPVPIVVPGFVLPPLIPIPAPIIVPPGTVFPPPVPFAVPPPVPLVPPPALPPPGTPPPPVGAPPPPPVFPVPVSGCAYLPASLTYTPPSPPQPTGDPPPGPSPNPPVHPYPVCKDVPIEDFEWYTCVNQCLRLYIPCPDWCHDHCK